MSESASAQATFVVNSIGDGGDSSVGSGGCNTGETIPGGDPECTLRAAIQEANNDTLKDAINFNIPGAGVHTILPGTGIPNISQPVIIDASTQPGYTTTPLVELDGSNAAANVVGLVVFSGDSTLRGLAINSFGASGVLLQTGGQNVVAGNHIGTDASGTVNKGNGIFGVAIIDSSHNTIGGSNPEDLNVISGNDDSGIAILNAPSTDNLVIGNLMGTAGNGQDALGNGFAGILISAEIGETEYASDNIIGGANPGEGNVISGNRAIGILLFRSPRNQILGNHIGIDVTGAAAVPNARDGIAIEDGPDNQIGGSSADAGNIISGNGQEGIVIGGILATGNKIEGNFIGTNLAGDAAIPNGRIGVLLTSFGAGLASSGTTVGSIEPLFGNVMSGNGRDGIQIGFGSENNTVIGNFVGTSADGLSAIGNQRRGVSIFDSDSNSIGGIAVGAENIISGNVDNGVLIAKGSLGHVSTDNFVIGNTIGLGSDGTTPLGNGINGVLLRDTGGNTIGGSDPDSGNTISGNTESGIKVTGVEANANIIKGNLVGTDRLGTIAKPNGFEGLAIVDAGDTVIGGVQPAEANIISGNTGVGIFVFKAKSTGTVIQGNFIGTNLLDDDLGNGESGISIEDSSDNQIGGVNDGEGNTVAFNGVTLEKKGHGITIKNGIRNSIRKNMVFDNHGRGIDLVDKNFPRVVPYAFTIPDPSEDANGDLTVDTSEDFNGNMIQDFADTDTGSNQLQNYPLVTDVKFTGGQKTVEWTLYSKPNTAFQVDIFANDEADASGFGEGKRFIKSVPVSTDAHGHGVFEETFSLEIVNGNMVGPLVSTTATDPDDNTSEFSMIDTDGDSIPDKWEELGVDIDEDGFVDFPFLGAGVPISDPLHKDLFVEVDSMGCTIRFPALGLVCFEPTEAEQASLVAAFANVPNQFVNNADGLNGISLHLDIDETIPHHPWVSEVAGDRDEAWPFFDKIKKNGSLFSMGGFGSAIERANRKTIAAKKLIFRYAIFADHFGAFDAGANKQLPTSGSGIAEATYGIKGAVPGVFVNGGNDFFVTLGLWTQQGGTSSERTGTFMHEMGHTLGLMHGGVDHLHRKPNYHSVMNYLWQTQKTNYSGGWKLDYSRVAFAPLNENSLNENAGLGGDFTTLVPVGPPVYRPDGTIRRRYELEFESGSIDYDRDGVMPVNESGAAIDCTPALPALNSCDINNLGYDDFNGDMALTNLDARLETLTSNADWSSLRFNFLGSPSSADGAHSNNSVQDEITLKLSQDMEAVADEPGTIGYVVTQAAVDEDIGNVTITVRRSNGVLGLVSVDYETIDDSALAGQDYNFSSGTLVFEEDEVYQSFNVEIVDDPNAEDNEVLQVLLSNPQGGAILGENLFLLGIRKNDGPGDLQFSNPFFDELEDAGTAAITVVRTGGTVGAVSVDYFSTDSNALDGEDYTAVSDTLNFADGIAIQTFTVPISQDTVIEGNEGLLLSLSNPTGGASLGAIDQAALTILNVAELVTEIDFALPSFEVGEEEGMRTIEVVRSKVLDTDVSVDIVTSDGTATAGADYIHTSVTLNFAPGELSKFVDIPILDDALAEGTEEVILSMENFSEEAFPGGIFTSEVRILDDEVISRVFGDGFEDPGFPNP